mgnify:CR=1 FL=1
MDEQRLKDEVDGDALYRDLRDQLATARITLDKLVYSGGLPLESAAFLAPHFDVLAAYIDSAVDLVRSSDLVHDCYECHGRGCHTCRDTGRVPKFLWDMRPEEFRGD